MTEGPSSQGYVALDRHECLQLLSSHHLGRIAVTVDGQPLIFPINYALHDGQVAFRTDNGTKLYGALDHKVAFEIDHFDMQYHAGWSVLVVGTAYEETNDARIAELERLPLSAWVPGPKPHWVQIRTDAMSGRRIER